MHIHTVETDNLVSNYEAGIERREWGGGEEKTKKRQQQEQSRTAQIQRGDNFKT